MNKIIFQLIAAPILYFSFLTSAKLALRSPKTIIQILTKAFASGYLITTSLLTLLPHSSEHFSQQHNNPEAYFPLPYLFSITGFTCFLIVRLVSDEDQTNIEMKTFVEVEADKKEEQCCELQQCSESKQQSYQNTLVTVGFISNQLAQGLVFQTTFLFIVVTIINQIILGWIFSDLLNKNNTPINELLKYIQFQAFGIIVGMILPISISWIIEALGSGFFLYLGCAWLIVTQFEDQDKIILKFMFYLGSIIVISIINYLMLY